MATDITKTPRLLAAAKEFNIGKGTLVDFLTRKGFAVVDSPAFKLTADMYDVLQGEYAGDKAAKRKSEEIALPKGASGDAKKQKEEAEFLAKTRKVEEVAAAVASEIEKPKEEKAPPVVEAKPQPVEEAKPVEAAPAAKPEPVAEKQPEPVVVTPPPVVEEAKPEPVAEKPEVKAEKPETTVEKPTAEATEPAKEEAGGHIETKSPKLDGPNILGKINLDDMNLSSRPKKGAPTKAAAKKADEPTAEKPVAAAKKEKQAEPKQQVPKQAPVVAQETPKVEAVKTERPKAETPKEEKPKATATPVAAKPPATPQQPAAAVEDDKPEHIEMNAPKLAGPKIIGKIDLSATESKGGDSREKRNRKRIPVNKRPEGNNPGTGTGAGGSQAGANGQQQNRGAGGGYGGGQQQQGQGGGGGFNRTGGAGSGGGDRRTGGGGYGQQGGGGQNRGTGSGGGYGDRRPQRSGIGTGTPQTPGEVDKKAIQDKIRQTQAKLAGNTRGRGNKQKYRRDKRDMMAERRAAEENVQGEMIQVTEFISVSELASLLDVSFADVISKCMGLGIMVSINQRLDAEVIELVANEFGHEVSFINLEQEADEEVEEVDSEEDMLPRAPIVTIMGHVDHGKTSLLDYIRSANVVAGEAGGITQHIGAYQVTTADNRKITFLDTPGHEAFTAMRARGAKVADIAVIVVAADDAIMPQTREAISHAQAAGLPMVFALNKIDKEGANPEKIKEQLSGMNILVEDWGGKFQSQEISAKKGLNVDLLLEKILLESDLLELKANPERLGSGSVIEASLDKGRGYQSTVLIQNGTLEQGDMIVCGQYYGKIRAMFNERGQRVTKAGPSAPVQVLGLNGAPQAGEKLKVFEEENEAKEVANHRAQIMREQGIRTRKHITLDEIGRRLALGNFKELAVIIKGDFDGSVEALSDSLQKLSTQEVAINVVHKAVGQITESDVLLATASDAIIIGFQVRPSMQASKLAEQENIEIRQYSIIYDAIQEIKSAMEGLLEPKLERKTVANVEVRQVYKINGLGTIAGCYVLDGKITRNTRINLVRDGIVVYNGELASLKRFKDDAKEVAAGYECGMSIKNYNDIRQGDIIEGYDEVEVKRTL